MRILLVEDHPDVAETIGDYLSARGHEVEISGEGVDGYRRAIEGTHDVLVVDRILPGMDGATLCSRLRNEAGRRTPILLLTALGATSDKLAGFAAGADDYLVKPFDLPELEARLIALQRRSGGGPSGDRLHMGELTYEPEAHLAIRGRRTLSLSPTGRRILEYLMRRGARVVTKQELEAHLWGDAVPEGDALPVHIHALRHALDHGEERKLLHTVRGVGYRLGPDAG